MTDITFAVLDVAPEPYAVTPILMARVGIASVGEEPVHAIALRCQVRIEPSRRQYSDDEAAEQVHEFGGLVGGVLAPRRFDANLTAQCDRVHRLLADGGDADPRHQDRRHRIRFGRYVEDGERDICHARSTTRLRLSSSSKNSSM